MLWHWSNAHLAAALRTGDPDARERLFSLGGDALAEQLGFREGASIDPEQLKAAAAAHARRYVSSATVFVAACRLDDCYL